MKARLLNCKIFLFLIFTGSFALAEMHASVKGSYRNEPSGQNLQASGAYDGLLWGQVDKKQALYGYYRLGASVGGTPTASVFAEVAPVAPLVFRLQQGTTYRFLESSVFDCGRFYCFGVMDRTDLSVTAVGGSGPWLGLISYLWRDLRTPGGHGPVVAEQEYFVLREGRHNYGEWTAALGYKRADDAVIGLQYMQGEVSDGNRRASSLYGVYQWPWLGLDWTAGAGRFESDEPGVAGNGIILTIGKKFGDSLSLF